MSTLQIIVQPSSNFHYRYTSEHNGTHGHIAGESSKKTNKTLPAVELRNPPDTASAFVIRCTLSAADDDSQHSNMLVKKTKINGLVCTRFYMYKRHKIEYFIQDNNL
jgi:hypothetical protein